MRGGLQLRAFAVAVVAAAALSGQGSRNAVTAVRFWSLGETTRVVIETEKDFEYRQDRVSGPDRLFFDVLGARLAIKGKGQHTYPVGDKYVRQIRVAETLPGVTRVVFDIEPGVDFVASRLSSPSRLIVELRSSGLGAPAKVAEPSTVSSREAIPPADSRSTIVAAGRAGDRQFSEVAQTPVRTTAPSEPVILATVPPVLKSTVKTDRLPDATRLKEKVSVPLRPPKAAKLGRDGSSMTRVLGLKIGRIVIDAGHGGHDTGTNGPGGLLEKDLVLDVAKRVGALIEARMGSEVVYTRSDDTFIPLEGRTRLANEQKADLFLSIHANSSPESGSSGVETYYLNFTTSKTAMEVAARENASSQKTVSDLKDIVQKIALQDKVDESREFAAKVQQSLYSASVRGNGRTRDRGVKKAPFVVLIGAAMPSILAEVGFISNPRDEALFQKPEFRQRIAEGLYKGLSQYANSLSQFNVAKTSGTASP